MEKIDLLKVLNRISRTLIAKPTKVIEKRKEDKKKLIKKEIEKWQNE